ncbi:MAG: ATP-dependent RNA helicase HrpA, partial [Acidimicrobiales bacterium]
GRCGRVAPGTCIRLYSEEDFQGRPEFTDPEILRTNLASVILQMAALGLGDVAAFPFVEPPDARSIKDGILLLEELGALERGGSHEHVRLTPVGRRLARIPADPRLARMVLEADRYGVVAEVLVLAAVLSIQDPRERPTGQEQAALQHHQRFADPESDFLSYLNLWRYLREQQKARGSSQFRRMCKAEHLHHLRIREWQDVHSQLRQVARGLRLDARPLAEEPDRDGIHRALLAGLLSHVGMLDPEGNEYRGAREARFVIAPGSALGKRRPKWVMAAELVETNRLRARTVAQITPDRIEQAAGHLVTRSYEEPWWEQERGTAMTIERVSLFGLPLVTGRRVQLDRIDRVEARALFLRHALVDGDWDGARHAFVRANQEQVAEVVALEERVRRDLLVSDDALVAFFDARVPAEVSTAKRFDAWWKKAQRATPDLVTYTPADLVEPAAGSLELAAFPETWRWGDAELALTYVLDPASDLDGVVVDVPLPLLDRVGAAGLDWQVPGHRHALVTALLRTLPKDLRRHHTPAADVAAVVLDQVGPADGPLLDGLAAALTRRGGPPVAPHHLDLAAVPGPLRVTYRAVDETGRPLAWSKD